MLIFENVTKKFGEDRVGLEDVSFNIDPGEFVFLTGHSGSGKTTMLRLLLKQYLLTTGEIFFEDTKVSKLKGNNVAKHRQDIGVVFQDSKLLPDFTVWENIALPLHIANHKKEEINERIHDLLNLVDMAGYDDFFPSQLSGGQAQRIGIARALATAPRLIFADEPTGNLDQKASEAILDLLSKINEYGTTIIFSTHNLNLLDRINDSRVLTLEYGHLINDTGKKKQTKIEEKAETNEEVKVEETTEEKSEETTVQDIPKVPVAEDSCDLNATVLVDDEVEPEAKEKKKYSWFKKKDKE